MGPGSWGTAGSVGPPREGFWEQAKATRAPTEARRGGTRGGLTRPRRQGEPEKGQLAGYASAEASPHPIPGDPAVLRVPKALPNPLFQGLRPPGSPVRALSGLPKALSRRVPGLLLPAPVPRAPAVHLAAGAAWTRHLR